MNHVGTDVDEEKAEKEILERNGQKNLYNGGSANRGDCHQINNKYSLNIYH
jgi:hypothetical protein